MKKHPKKSLSDLIRKRLNKLPEKDSQGNNYRIGWQVLTYLVANAAEGSADPKIRLLGKSAKNGAKLSFIDLALNKVIDWLDGNNNSCQLTKSCSYCGCVVDSWNDHCANCFSKI